MENAPSKSWLGSLVVGSEVTYHYSLGSVPAVVREIGEHCIWLGIKINQNEFSAKVASNGLGPHSSRISQRDSDICELSPHWESHMPPWNETC